MNTKLKIVISVAVLTVLGVGSVALLNKKTPENIEIKENDYQNIYNNIEKKTEVKAVGFDTEEEMYEYTEKINTISGLEEAEGFLKTFYQACYSNKKETMLTFYSEYIWDYILQTEAFPFYDESGVLSFVVEDMVVRNGDIKDEYIVNYNLKALDSETKEELATLVREDKFQLEKMFEVISIVDYNRNTIETKYK